MGKKGPKKHSRFARIESVKRYIFCSSYDDLFLYGTDYMTQVEYIDYGLGWDKLKPGESGDQVMFEIVDFEVMSDIDQIMFEKRWEKQRIKEEAAANREKARKKMRNRVKRALLGKYYRRFYWLPGLVHGRVVLTLTSFLSNRSRLFNCPIFRFGAYVYSLALAYCLRVHLSS